MKRTVAAFSVFAAVSVVMPWAATEEHHNMYISPPHDIDVDEVVTVFNGQASPCVRNDRPTQVHVDVKPWGGIRLLVDQTITPDADGAWSTQFSISQAGNRYSLSATCLKDNGVTVFDYAGIVFDVGDAPDFTFVPDTLTAAPGTIVTFTGTTCSPAAPDTVSILFRAGDFSFTEEVARSGESDDFPYAGSFTVPDPPPADAWHLEAWCLNADTGPIGAPVTYDDFDLLEVAPPPPTPVAQPPTPVPVASALTFTG